MYIFCVYMHACIQHAHATAHVEIRGQLLEASSLSPLWNLGNNGQLARPRSSFRLVGSIQCPGPTLIPSFPRDWGLLSFAVTALAMTRCL